MNRRRFLEYSGLLSLGLALPGSRPVDAFAPDTDAAWRTFEITTSVEVLKPSGPTRVWVPAVVGAPTPFQKPIENTWHAESGSATIGVDPRSGAGIVSAEWAEGVRPVLSVTSRVATRDIAVGLKPSARRAADPASARGYLRPTRLQPLDGIVRKTAMEATHGARTDREKARAIYEWIVEHTFRDPKTRGCGRGDVRFMLESGDLGGKCADINALYVALARAAGLPARDFYGVRVAPSRRGFKSLGAGTSDITHAQHCRAEVYLHGEGWVPVDPADVRKVVLEEPPGHMTLESEPAKRARALLFGSWEMNWVAFNDAADVTLPGWKGDPLPFFMYPQCQTTAGPLDSLDADAFRYSIASREVA